MVLLSKFCSAHSSFRIACSFLFLFVCTCLPTVAQERDGCNPSPEVKAALDALPQRIPVDTDWGFREKTRTALEAILSQYSSDFFAQKQYIQLIMWSRTDRAKTIEKYKSKLDANPDSPELAYLYGLMLVGRQSPEAIKLFSKALEKDPKFPWPHLSLARIYGSPVFHDKAKQKAHAGAFLDACPEVAEGYYPLREIDDKELLRNWAVRLRSRLAKRSDRAAMNLYSNLWLLEFKAAAPSDYTTLRKQVGTDVQRIRALNLKSTEWYEALVEGYTVADEQKISDEIRDEWERAFPNPTLPSAASFGNWFKEHPLPKSEADAAARRAYYQALLEQSKKWTRERPNTAFLWDYPMDALVELDAPAAEIEAAADKKLEVAKKNAGPDAPLSYEWLNVARALARKHLQPDRVLEYAETGLAQLEIEKKERDYDLYDTKSRIAERQWDLANQEIVGKGYVVDAQLQLKHVDKAQIELARLDECLQDLKILAGDKQDKKKDYLAMRSVYWGRMARLSELQERKLDAMGFYENALLARLDAEQKPETSHKDELAEDAKKLWITLGGTEVGWTMWYGRRAEELARANTLRWEEANEALPAFALADLNGKSWNLEALKGKVTFLNFWASW